jgi:hypothetical protein
MSSDSLEDVVPDDGAAAARGIEDPAEHANRRGLAGAVRAEYAEDLTPTHGERDIAHGDEAAELARKSMRLDDELGRVRHGAHRDPPESSTKTGRPA